MKCDVLVIGAGCIGSAIASSLAGRGITEVLVIDFDLEGTLSSSELNAGGVRATFHQPINIQMSKKTIEYFEAHADQVGYRPVGYLWLHQPPRMETALKARERQVALGWDVEVWDLATLARRAPLIDKTSDLAGATFGPRDGLINPNLMKLHFREKAKEAGAKFLDRTAIRSAERASGGLRVRCETFSSQIDEGKKREWLSGAPLSSSGTLEIEAKKVVNSAGAWAGAVARGLGYASPVFAVRRQISLFDSRDADLSELGMVVDSSGVYFHPEASFGLAGFADHAESRGINYEYGGDAFFQESIWAHLYERSTRFEKLRHISGWAGQYEVSPDESAVLGPVQGALDGLVYEAHSFSGHGVMHAYAAGEAIGELLSRGSYQSIDASVLAGRRFETGNLIRESAVI